MKTFKTLRLRSFLALLILYVTTAAKPKIYTIKADYERAMAHENHQLASYINYRKK